MIYTIINKYSGQELRCQFHTQIGEDEEIIEELRIDFFENPYWDFENKIFYNKNI